MIAERLPQLAAMPRKDKWLVMHELEDEFFDDRYHSAETAEAKQAVLEELDRKLQRYSEHPESSPLWESVRTRLRQQLAEWRLVNRGIPNSGSSF